MARTIQILARALFSAVLAVALFGESEAAQPTPVLVELFTSEGCSSCPPADDLLARLDRTQSVSGAQLVVLSEHVDYWNQLGWRDPFSSAKFSARQGDYARRIDASGSVYTPEAVVDGRVGAVGSDDAAVRNAIARVLKQPKVPLTIVRASRSGGKLRFHIDAMPLPRSAVLYVALADENDRSRVTAGENAGRTLSHVAVVRSLVELGTVSAGRTFTRDVSVGIDSNAVKPLRIVAFFQDPASGAILALDERSLGGGF